MIHPLSFMITYLDSLLIDNTLVDVDIDGVSGWHQMVIVDNLNRVICQ